MKELLLLSGFVVAVLVVATARHVMLYGRRNAWSALRYDWRFKGSLRVGDVAPDAVLTSLDGQAQVRLRERFRGRPVVIIFGSYT